MTENRMAEKLASGGTVLGAWMMLREPLAAVSAAKAGYDYVCCDMQHGLADFSDAAAMLAALAGQGATPLVRTPSNDAGTVGRLLDAGAMGIIFPMINTAVEAEAAVAACRYAPTGHRSLGPIGAGVLHGRDYFAKANETVSVIAMIETEEAIRNLDDILAVEGIDTIYVGPADLSLTLGLPPGYDHDDDTFKSAIMSVLHGCRRHGVTPGIHCLPSLVEKRSNQGFRMMTIGYDNEPLFRALYKDLKAGRAAIG